MKQYIDVFGLGYHHTVGIVGTDFLAIGIGMMAGTLATVKVMQAAFNKDKLAGRRPFTPESRSVPHQCKLKPMLLF
jgi:hypothetical protein